MGIAKSLQQVKLKSDSTLVTCTYIIIPTVVVTRTRHIRTYICVSGQFCLRGMIHMIFQFLLNHDVSIREV